MQTCQSQACTRGNFSKSNARVSPKMAQAAKTHSFSYAFGSEINRYPKRTTGLPLSQNDLSHWLQLRKLDPGKNLTSVHTHSQHSTQVRNPCFAGGTHALTSSQEHTTREDITRVNQDLDGVCGVCVCVSVGVWVCGCVCVCVYAWVRVCVCVYRSRSGTQRVTPNHTLLEFT